MRKPPNPPRRSPQSASAESAAVLCEERTFQFITPVFGGGVRVAPAGDVRDREEDRPPRAAQREPDPRTPIRVPSIRGQLRFWWRACNPQECADVEALLHKESLVFGSTTQPSQVSIAVVRNPGAPRDVPVFRDRFGVVEQRDGRAYAAFPLRDTGKENRHGVLHEYPGEWTIALAYPRGVAFDIDAAFWAWAHFGGLGGRTRRGFGAIAEMRRSRGALESIDDGWKRYVKGIQGPGVIWPHLAPFDKRRLRIKSGAFPRGRDGAAAQEYLLEIMRRLRQGEIGRKPVADDVPGKHPGRSYWPEPDTLRKLTGMRSRRHAKPVTNLDAFPRAAFGMPIIFHFKDSDDPCDCTLVPTVGDGSGAKHKGRLASPLILRPHHAADGNIEALALALEHPPPDDLRVREKIGSGRPAKVFVVSEATNLKRPGAWTLTKTEALRMGLGGRPSPLQTSNGSVVTDPIDRFLEEIR